MSRGGVRGRGRLVLGPVLPGTGGCRRCELAGGLTIRGWVPAEPPPAVVEAGGCPQCRAPAVAGWCPAGAGPAAGLVLLVEHRAGCRAGAGWEAVAGFVTAPTEIVEAGGGSVPPASGGGLA